ncbi:MAG: sugar ABC transporter substrate-binding protein [Bradyrhizobium sp.]|uniref:ABC transporter substrate-binding protein n=1 Tax=Bradyrhizobium sp. TaxID=376 RepID=UPI00121C7820|nr:sugar ABC transporter substrate-binding protein [Bradyrhizobium sp.]THD60255.1 MAG: sugar ABC transporter substrate-binding protein [Bradyrhizobium sp.]
MTDRDKHTKTEQINHGRRDVLRTAAVLGVGAVAAPYLIRTARAQAADLGAYTSAKINWRQAEGEQITVGVIPAGYFDNLVSLSQEFEALTGIKVRFEKIPPGQVRQKAMLDLSSKTGTYATVATDCMYYPLYAVNKWVEPLDTYLNDTSLTDPSWFQYNDIHKAWRDANTVDGKPYAIPYDGEMTVQVYRKDLYDAKGLKPAETLEQFVENAKALHDPSNRLWGAALRGFAGAGQNMYIYPSIFRSYGGNWMSGDKIQVNSKEATDSLDWYVDTLTKYAPQAVRNWNWPDIADAFAQGTLGAYIDAHSSAAVLNNSEKSKVIGKIGFARWPKGPAGKRVTSIWNWGFPINAALSPKAKQATWMFISWAAAAETQARTSWKFAGPVKRSGLNRLSIWKSPEFGKLLDASGYNFGEASLQSLELDTDVDWRPRVPQWPALGEAMATGIQAALVGQKKSKEALDEAQARIDAIMKG